MTAPMADRIAWMRALIGAVVGGFLVIYAAVSHAPNRVVIAIVGLLLLGAISVDAAFFRRGGSTAPEGTAPVVGPPPSTGGQS